MMWVTQLSKARISTVISKQSERRSLPATTSRPALTGTWRWKMMLVQMTIMTMRKRWWTKGQLITKGMASMMQPLSLPRQMEWALRESALPVKWEIKFTPWRSLALITMFQARSLIKALMIKNKIKIRHCLMNIKHLFWLRENKV